MSIISTQSIQSNAELGFYYDQNQKLLEVNLFERVFRLILFPFFDSVEVVCTQRSWKAIATIDKLPEQIANEVTHFFENPTRKNPLSRVVNSAARIYARICQQKNGSSFPYHFKIDENPKQRLFEVENGAIVSSDEAVLDFYADRKKTFINRHDDLLDSSEVIARVKQVLYVPHTTKDWDFNYQYELFEGDWIAPSFFVKKNEADSPKFSEESFLARDARTNKIVAIVEWNQDKSKLQHWSVTLADPSYWSDNLSKYQVFEQKGSKLDFLIWVLLKHSQKKFRGEHERPFVKNYA